MKFPVYLDNASTTKMSRTAIDAMLPFLSTYYANPSSPHTAGQTSSKALADAREKIADCIGGSPKEITFTSGGSEADNQAILSAAQIGKKSGKNHILSTSFEHHAVLRTLNRLELSGFDVTLLGVPENGIISPEQVRKAIRANTCLVTVMYANNEIGTIQPIKEIGQICRDKKILFHTDAVQAAGHLPIRVDEENIDMLSLSAHKFHGPKGAGVLYARKGIPLTSLIEGGAQERGKRAGTENVPACVAMAAALEEACVHLNDNTQKITALRDKLIKGLSEIPRSTLNGDRHTRLCGNVNFCFEGIESEALLLLLDQEGIYASSGSACASGSFETSHVLLAIGKDRDLAGGALRLSLSEENNEEEIDYTIHAVKKAVKHLRNF